MTKDMSQIYVKGTKTENYVKIIKTEGGKRQ